MRVALVGPVYPYRGGIAHYTTLLALHLGDHLVHVISFRRQYPRWLFPGRSDRDTSQRPLTIDGVQYEIDPLDPLSWWRTAKMLREIQPDILVLQWWVSYWAPCLASIMLLYRRWVPDTPILFLCHNVLPHETHWWDRLLAKMVLPLATHYLVHSTQDRARLLDLVPGARVEVAQFPTYGELIAGQCTKREARWGLGLDPEAPVLLFFGFVRPYKGLEYLVQALERVRRQIDAHLLVVGEFWESKERYLRLIGELALEPHVSIVDRYVPNEDLALYLAAADVVVLPYVETSQSAAARLALDAGVPVIASDVGGLGELIADGTNGLLVRPCDVQSLAEAIVRFFAEGLGQRLQVDARQQDGGGWREIVAMLEHLAEAGHGAPDLDDRRG